MDVEIKAAAEKLMELAIHCVNADDLDVYRFRVEARPVLEELWAEARASVSAQDFEF